MKWQTYEKGEILIQEGEAGDTFYLVREGTLGVYKRSQGRTPVAVLESGSFFGEIALLQDIPRTASVIAHSAGEVFLLKKEAFLQVIDHSLYTKQVLSYISSERMRHGTFQTSV